MEFVIGEEVRHRVMFGGSAVTGFELTEDDRRIGVHTLAVARDAIQRRIRDGRFRPVEPRILIYHLWCQVHGLVSLELAGYGPALSPPRKVLSERAMDFEALKRSELTRFPPKAYLPAAYRALRMSWRPAPGPGTL